MITRAGLPNEDMEFVQFHPTGMTYDYVHTMPAHFENGENCDSSKVSASLHMILAQFVNDTKFYSNKPSASALRIWC